MGFENFGFSPERNLEGDLTQATEGLAEILRLVSPEERELFVGLNRAANSFLEEDK
jgi:hypothetical protein